MGVSAILGMWPEQFVHICYIFKRSIHMKFMIDRPNGLWENCVLMSNTSHLKWKVNLDLWDSFIALNISGDLNDWLQQFSKNQLFKKIPI